MKLWLEPLERRELLSADPILTEFMASNQGWQRDGDGGTPDWIEIHNAGDADVDLAGYRLTDDPENLSRWVFPGRNLAAGEYLVVFASGQDVAYTRFNVDRGLYDTPQIVEITTDTPEAEIFYTTDGSVPSPTSATAKRYSRPLTVATTTTLRAAGYRADFVPTNVGTHTYVFIDDVLRQPNSPAGYPDSWKTDTGPLPAGYEMDAEITQHAVYEDVVDDALLAIPTISIVTDVESLFDFDTGIYMNPEQKGVDWERPASVEIFFPDGVEGVQADAGLRIQGGNSRRPHLSPKHSLRL